MLTTESGIIAIEVLAAQGPVGTRGGVEWMRGPCAQYCSNKKNDKIEKAIVRIERRDREGMVRLALVLAVELFEHAGVGSQAARRQELSREPSEHLLLQALSL